MLKITAEEINFIVYQYLHETGFTHSAYSFSQEANIQDNKFSHYQTPSGLLILFLEKALTLSHMETHVTSNHELQFCEEAFQLLNPHYCKSQITSKPEEDKHEQSTRTPLNGQSEINSLKSIMHDQGLAGNVLQNKDIEMNIKDSSPPVTHDPSSEILLTNEKNAKIIVSHSGDIFNVAWSPNKRTLVSCGHDHEGQLWFVPDSDIDGTISISNLPHMVSADSQEPIQDITDVKWNCSGTQFVTIANDGLARIWSSEGRMIKALEGHEGILYSACWNKDGTAIVTGGRDKVANLWNPKGSIVQQFHGHTSAITDISWKNNTEFATASEDLSILFWKVGQKDYQRKLIGHKDDINTISWDPAGSLLASCSEDKTAMIWSPVKDEPVHVFKDHSQAVSFLEWSPTGLGTSFPNDKLILATCSYDSTVRLWDVEYGKLLNTLKEHDGSVVKVRFSPDYKYLASCGYNGAIVIWSVKDFKQLKKFKMEKNSMMYDVNWSFDGHTLAAGYPQKLVLLDMRYF